MNPSDAMPEEIISLARGLRDLQEQAAQQYKPVVDGILRTRSHDIRHIEHTLDGLLDFCGHEPVLRMYKDLCRYYGTSIRPPPPATSTPTANPGIAMRRKVSVPLSDLRRQVSDRLRRAAAAHDVRGQAARGYQGVADPVTSQPRAPAEDDCFVLDFQNNSEAIAFAF